MKRKREDKGQRQQVQEDMSGRGRRHWKEEAGMGRRAGVSSHSGDRAVYSRSRLFQDQGCPGALGTKQRGRAGRRRPACPLDREGAARWRAYQCFTDSS